MERLTGQHAADGRRGDDQKAEGRGDGYRTADGREPVATAMPMQAKPARSFKPGWRRMWRSSSVRRLAVIFLLAFGTAAILLWAYSSYSADRLGKDWIARETAALGALAARDPALAEAWARQLGAGDATPAEAALGRELAARYGIDAKLDAALVPLAERRRSREWPLLAAGVFGLLAALLLVLLRESRRQLAEVRGLAGSLEAAVKENRPMKFRIYAEGELGLLAHQVQELSMRLQETIAQLNRDKDFLRDTIADISHQLKTPLASLTVYVELLQGGGVGPAEQEEFLRTCGRELERMEWLIQTLLKLARLEAGSLPMQLERAPIGQTVRTAVHAVGRLAEERRVEICLQEPAEAVSLPHDSRWLAEAIANLVKNAVEHSPPARRRQRRMGEDADLRPAAGDGSRRGHRRAGRAAYFQKILPRSVRHVRRRRQRRRTRPPARQDDRGAPRRDAVDRQGRSRRHRVHPDAAACAAARLLAFLQICKRARLAL
ncbi:sensor histidine kinase [Cohnella rhizosphaerae]|uniref:histidine kinase n=1 Tax=Cohnella rhizosphaerae TaxID=1457232 RepID=A0A9X4KPY1_9BACL|nr:HAMP domain-containing sensor histidine kinase [Cohnella rhizosphaerae]MDG0809046.1 HAMP domain-containing histidine kinase [Cohnella rhizosphaerae]